MHEPYYAASAMALPNCSEIVMLRDHIQDHNRHCTDCGYRDINADD